MRRMYSKEQLNKLIEEVSKLIAIEELDKVVPLPALEKAGYVMTVNAAGTGYELKNVSGVVDGATIRPANVFATTKITANEIVENMSGYSFRTNTLSNVTLEYIYAGIVKNGNKLTSVVFAKITTASGYDKAYNKIGGFTIPEDVGAKLIPYTLGTFTTLLDFRKMTAFNSTGIGAASAIDTGCYITKTSNTTFDIHVNMTDMVEGTSYLVRIEQTFLLSDNLIPQE